MGKQTNGWKTNQLVCLPIPNYHAMYRSIYLLRKWFVFIQLVCLPIIHSYHVQTMHSKSSSFFIQLVCLPQSDTFKKWFVFHPTSLFAHHSQLLCIECAFKMQFVFHPTCLFANFQLYIMFRVYSMYLNSGSFFIHQFVVIFNVWLLVRLGVC